jgi:hypothetical protein
MKSLTVHMIYAKTETCFVFVCILTHVVFLNNLQYNTMQYNSSQSDSNVPNQVRHSPASPWLRRSWSLNYSVLVFLIASFYFSTFQLAARSPILIGKMSTQRTRHTS